MKPGMSLSAVLCVVVVVVVVVVVDVLTVSRTTRRELDLTVSVRVLLTLAGRGWAA